MEEDAKTEGLRVDGNFYNVNCTGIGMLLHMLEMSGEIRSNILSLSTLVVKAMELNFAYSAIQCKSVISISANH